MARLVFLNIEGRFTGNTAARKLLRLRPEAGYLNVLSLKDLEFIDPFGLLLAAEYLRYLKFALKRTALYLPMDARVYHYLQRSRFLEFANSMADLMPERRASQVYTRQQEEEWLLSMTPLKGEEEVPGLVAQLYQRLLNLIEHSEAITGSEAAQLSSLLAELCQNVTQHSQDLGLVAAQVYRAGQGRFIQLAVADLGIGLRGSLAHRYPVDDWDDRELIKQAISQGVSSVIDTGRGLGLALVYRKTAELGGRMLLRSGSVLLESRAGVDTYYDTGYFPGTQISLEYRAQTKA